MREDKKQNQWIIQKLFEHNYKTRKVYDLYDEFSHQFPGHFATIETFKRGVRRVRAFVEGDDDVEQLIERDFVVVQDKDAEAGTLTNEELWELQKRLSAHELASVIKKRKHDIYFDDSGLPIGIVFMADHHIGEDGVNYQLMEDDQKLIKATKGAYQIFVGDINNNDVRHVQSMIESNTSPSRQMCLMDYYLSIAGERLLIYIKGNHDEMTKSVSGLDHLDEYFKSKRIPYGGNGQILVNAHVGNQVYKVLATHKYRYNSSFNPTHTNKRLWEMGRENADVLVVAHNHSPSCEPFYKHGKLKWGIRPGSYLVTRNFERNVGYNDGEADFQVLILYPDRKDMCVIHRLHHGLNFLRSERERYKSHRSESNR